MTDGGGCNDPAFSFDWISTSPGTTPLDQDGVELLDNDVVPTWLGGRAGWCDGWDDCDDVPGIAR